jgi:hypothetical protein
MEDIMTQASIDWPRHVKAYRSSSQSLTQYCAANDLKPQTFRYYLYKKKARSRESQSFKEFAVKNELVISLDQNGALQIGGFDLTHLPQIIGAWSNALPR